MSLPEDWQLHQEQLGLASGPSYMCSQGGLTQGRETKYLPGPHLSLGALLVSKQRKKKEKEKKTSSVEIKDEGSKENVNSINESYTILYLPKRKTDILPYRV